MASLGMKSHKGDETTVRRRPGQMRLARATERIARHSVGPPPSPPETLPPTESPACQMVPSLREGQGTAELGARGGNREKSGIYERSANTAGLTNPGTAVSGVGTGSGYLCGTRLFEKSVNDGHDFVGRKGLVSDKCVGQGRGL